MTRINVVCVNVENYLGRGEEYVAKLEAMVARNLKLPYRFICIDESERRGWWAKIDLFAPNLFDGRVLYLDLDTVIVGPLEPLIESKGIIHLKDWGWKKNDYGSSVMVWDAGEHEEIWSRYDKTVPALFRGDQDWLTHLGGWPALPKGLNVSYRYHAVNGPPKGAVTVSMHGLPKPHQIASGWVPELWKE